ncbi:MAG: 5-formyltetrahydrofolate cyclo-ligase [Armatimonas sp.]
MPVLTPESDKAALRAFAREVRARQDPPILWPILAVLPEFQRAQHVLLYAAMHSEIDVLPLADTTDKQFYLPRCAPKRRLAIHNYPCPLVAGPFGIREPAATLPEVEPEILDLVLVPGLLFTTRGIRLGYGGGYYDRFLPRLRKDCITVGITSSPQLAPELPEEPWDYPVSLVVTELGIADPRSL